VKLTGTLQGNSHKLGIDTQKGKELAEAINRGNATIGNQGNILYFEYKQPSE
jgi:hypothetical protein